MQSLFRISYQCIYLGCQSFFWDFFIRKLELQRKRGREEGKEEDREKERYQDQRISCPLVDFLDGRSGWAWVWPKSGTPWSPTWMAGTQAQSHLSLPFPDCLQGAGSDERNQAPTGTHLGCWCCGLLLFLLCHSVGPKVKVSLIWFNLNSKLCFCS